MDKANALHRVHQRNGKLTRWRAGNGLNNFNSALQEGWVSV
jgi:hypothetical protein